MSAEFHSYAFPAGTSLCGRFIEPARAGRRRMFDTEEQAVNDAPHVGVYRRIVNVEGKRTIWATL